MYILKVEGRQLLLDTTGTGENYETNCNCEESLTLCLPVSSADNLGKQFGPRSESSGLIRVHCLTF